MNSDLMIAFAYIDHIGTLLAAIASAIWIYDTRRHVKNGKNRK